VDLPGTNLSNATTLMSKMNLAEAFSRVTEHWRPKVIAELNDQEVKLVKCQGTFVWHQHDDVDELFLVWRGLLRVEFRDRVVELAEGDLLVVPRGVEHRTVAQNEVEMIVFEPAGTRNTGNITSESFTAPIGEKL
jgi:mannose-6-phosphate isomerase-like protein (cupin superfamily)